MERCCGTGSGAQGSDAIGSGELGLRVGVVGFLTRPIEELGELASCLHLPEPPIGGFDSPRRSLLQLSPDSRYGDHHGSKSI
jgi:hypothetical protein